MNRKYLLKIAVIALLTLSQNVSAATWKVVGKPRVFSNMNGVIVTVVDLNPAGKTKRAIVEVSGTSSDADREPYLTEVRDEGRRVNYINVVGKDEYYTLTMSRSGSYWSDVTLPIPGSRTPASLSFNDKRSKEADGNAILTKLLLRRSSGSNDAKANQAADDKRYQEAGSEASEACSTKFSATIDWSSFKGDVAKNLDVGEACAQVFEAITSQCAEDEGKKALKKFTEISCTAGTSPTLTASGKKISFKTAPDSPGQFKMIFNWFDNNL